MTLTSKQQAALNLLGEGEEYENYFFGKVDGLEWFQPLKERGYFAPSKNPSPREAKEAGYYTIPQWAALTYLERVAQKSVEPPNRSYAEEILEIMAQVTRPATGQRTDNYRTWWYFTKFLGYLPTETIRLEHLDMLDDWLGSQFDTTLVAGELAKSIVPRFLQSEQAADWQKAVRILEIVTKPRPVSETQARRRPDDAHLGIEAHWLCELFEKNAKSFGEKCGSEASQILCRRLREVVTRRDDELSYIWRPAIEEHEQNLNDESARFVLISGLRDVMLAYVAHGGTSEVEATMLSMASDELQVIARIAIHLINVAYDSYGRLFSGIVRPELFDSNYKHELYGLLRLRFRRLSEPEQLAVLRVINSLTREWREGVDAEQANAYLRATWLHAIQGQGNQDVDAAYGHYVSISGYTPENPDFASYVTEYHGEVSPKTVENLLQMQVGEVAQYLRTFQEKSEWGAPTRDGLGEALRGAVAQRPGMFEPALHEFEDVDHRFQLSVVRGFAEAWGKKQGINWGGVLQFCENIIRPDAFWDHVADEEHVRQHRWTGSAIADLIKAGTQSDAWAFEEPLLPTAKNILIRLLEKIEPTANGNDQDGLSEAINTDKGRALEALFAYCLRRARLVDVRGDSRETLWTELQPMFEHEVAQSQDGNLEFSALAGAYLPNLQYLSKEWVAQNINRLFPLTYERNWRCAIEGYAYVNRVYGELYHLLRTNGHFQKALTYTFRNHHIRQKLIQNVCIMYLENKEALIGRDSLMAELLERFDYDDISHIIWFFWTLRKGGVKEEAREAILALWRWCYGRINGDTSRNGRILSQLTLLTAFLKQLSGEPEAWVLQAAPYVDEAHHSSFFLEYLDNLATESPDAVGRVYLVMLERALPVYEKSRVRSIVKKLYASGNREAANAICDVYSRKGHDRMVRDIYEECNH